MGDQNTKIEAAMERPINCSNQLLNRFASIVLASGEVPRANLQSGIPKAEMLFFMLADGAVVGASAVRYQEKNYHRHLFERAGVPEMYNPYSVEVCWLSILPEYRNLGGWNLMHKLRKSYLGNRPHHAITRVENKKVSDLSPYGYERAGKPFYPATDKNLIQLAVANHDPIYDPSKRLIYAKPQ
ncbi:hypothetical protein [Sneathiella limimaris]|uniref:hypothetical protein n=1 Tax=Sneathiella limimaris TaxID=1964213 RepID=UPI00146BF556|nr:hypothetical protein [Sneathiella limimaris]